MTKLFFDTEFTGLHSEAKLISIGIVSEDGRYFYAELNDYDKEKDTTDFVKKNVLPNLLFLEPKEGEELYSSKIRHEKNVDFHKSYSHTLHCDMNELKLELTNWLNQFDKVCFWGDCLAYDWVLFRKIFEFEYIFDSVVIKNQGDKDREIFCDFPKNVHYIPFDLSTLFHVMGMDEDVNREEFIRSSGTTEFLFNNIFDKHSEWLNNKHNALYDAEIISRCYALLTFNPKFN